MAEAAELAFRSKCPTACGVEVRVRGRACAGWPWRGPPTAEGRAKEGAGAALAPRRHLTAPWPRASPRPALCAPSLRLPAPLQWTGAPPYTPEGLMVATQPYGLMECDASCTRTPACAYNNQVGAPRGPPAWEPPDVRCISMLCNSIQGERRAGREQA
jgi:hypothetical protein